jgi:hypothetical protein
MKIIVGGGFSYVPFSPGAAWTRLEQALGLMHLGHDVLIVEEASDGWCYNRAGEKTSYEESWSRELFTKMMARFGVLERASQVYDKGRATTGVPLDQVTTFAREADLLINNSGHVTFDAILSGVDRRVYIDLDPVYTQLWYAEYGKHRVLDRHDVFFTVGANIGTKDSDIPDCGKEWHYLPRILDLDRWGFALNADTKNFTTIANWAGFGELEFRGKTFKPKYAEFLRYADLPRLTSQSLQVWLKNYDLSDPRIEELTGAGWSIENAAVIDSLDSYQDFIQKSRAEVGIAQNAYVEGKSGWFSDRSAQYLASGKPVLAQSTGFESHLPTGAGLFSFSTIEDAAQGIDEINANYSGNCRAARDLAAAHFDYRKVLPEMLSTCL